MFEFLRNIFNADFVPHGHCYFWQPSIVWLHVLSDSLIALSYYSIPVALIYFVRKRRDLAFPWIFVMFGVFILGCGTTHVMEVITVWNPVYRLSGVIKLLTGVVSMATGLALIPLLPRALKLPSPGQLAVVNRDLEREIGERRRAEAALQSAKEALESEVAGRTAELSFANVELKREIAERERAQADRLKMEERTWHSQKLESLGVLAGGVAHDFNNLLVVILGNAELAVADLPDSSPVRSRLHQIEIAASRAADLTNQMLAYTGKGRFVAEPIDLSSLVAEMTHLLESVVTKKAELRCHLAARLPAVMGDPGQLRQIVMNLITNASDAIRDGIGTITVTTGAADLDARDLSEALLGEGLDAGRYVFVEVADTGCGMDEVTRARIFDPFFSTKFTGRGLGLAATHGIVRGHLGAIALRSAPGQGTNFKVFLPATAGAREAGDVVPNQTVRPAPVLGPKESGTILVVDDEEGVRAVAESILRSMGFDVLLAEDGRKGLDVFGDHRDVIDLVILDLTMPEMDGEEVLKEIHRVSPEARVVLSSGYSETDVIKRFAGKGIAGFIQKPYRVESFLETLRAAMRGPSRSR
ncbi:MAG: response regulator [Acidobacteria bacterium]|nr:response regulator [Acidobacteriota bacterium]